MNDPVCNKLNLDKWVGPESLRGKCCCDCAMRLTVRKPWESIIREGSYVCIIFDAVDHNRYAVPCHEHGICEMWTEMTTQDG